MLFTVALIVKNEEKNLDHLFNSLKNFMNDGGKVLILDTGSTDDTVQKAKTMGFNIEISPISFIEEITEKNYEKMIKLIGDNNWNITGNKKYFNFSKARNYIHNYLRTKMVLQLDASQHIINFNYNFINNKIKNDKTLKFKYMCYYGNENSGYQLNEISRFYHTDQYTWKRDVHEILETSSKIIEFKLPEEILSVKHIRSEKERNYLPGLFNDYFNNKKTPRCIYYLARELFYYRFYDASIKIASKFLDLDKNNIWIPELAGIYILIADCYEKLNIIEKAIENFKLANEAYKGMRNPLIRLAEIYIKLNNDVEALEVLFKCLKTNKESEFVEPEIYYTYYPHEMIFQICSRLQNQNSKYTFIGKTNLDICIKFNKKFEDFKILFPSPSPSPPSSLSLSSNIIDTNTEKEKIIVFYLSYGGINDSNIYGSELACVNLSNSLSSYFSNNEKLKIFIVDDICRKTIKTVNNITYIDIKIFDLIKNRYSIEVLIISRYINYFLYYNFSSKKTFLWIHDIHLCPYYEGDSFSREGYYILKNCIHKIDKLITLTKWHSHKFVEFYDFVDYNKIKIIGNGIDITNFLLPSSSSLEEEEEDLAEEEKEKKEGFRFIWTSALNRNIEICVEIFKLICKEYPKSTLHIFRETTNYEKYIETLKDYSNIIFYGSVDHSRIISEFKKSDIWLYPTFWEETYCISALEAQYSKTLCIYNSIGSLGEVIGNRGIVIPPNLLNNIINIEEIAKFILNKLNDKELIDDMIDKGYEFAKNRDWDKIATKWVDIF